ncbi:proline iminopeptidase-family hydrolase [soil metagenome]
MRHISSFLALLLLLFTACQPKPESQPEVQAPTACSYMEYATDDAVQAGGIHMVKLKEGYQVWTKRIGNSPTMKVLLLHGGPAGTHELMIAFESFFPQAKIELYQYDQLGSYHSDQPDDMSLWTIARFVEEVEQVRIDLGLDSSNFFLLGQSWGGILAMEYALKYQHNLKGLIVSNMTADFDRYEAYNNKLRGELPKEVLDTLTYYESRQQFQHPRYVDLMYTAFYKKHICRLEPWPEPVTRSFKHFNQVVYEYMQGPSEFVPGGILKGWSVWNRLKELTVPTLMIGAKYDSMNPEEMKEMSTLVQNGSYLFCPNGSHLCQWDDQKVYMEEVIGWIKSIAGK